MKGTSMAPLMKVSTATQRVMKRRMLTAMMLPTTSAQISVQTRSRCSVSMAGPGWMPRIRKAPIITAMPDEPGMPKNSVGSSEPPSLALLAVSGAITPSTAPLPKRSGCFELCTAWP